MPTHPEWFTSIEAYVAASPWAKLVGTYQELEWRARQDPSDELLMVTPEQITEAKAQLKKIEADWEAAKKSYATGGETMPATDWGYPPAKSLGVGTTPLGGVPGEEAPTEPEVPTGDTEYVESIAADLEMAPESVLGLMKQIFPAAENAVAEFRDAYGEMGPAAGLYALKNAAEEYLGVPTTGVTTEGGWTGGAPSVGVGAGVGGEGVEYPPGAYFNYLKAQLMPGGPGTAGEYYGAIGDIASPLAGEDTLEFLSRMTQPGQYMPSTFYSLLGKSMLPMGQTMPEGFYGLLSKAMPSAIAPGTPTPDFSFMGALGQPGAPELGGFLAQMVQSNPELGLALMEASIGMQQEYAMPFLQFLLGPGAMGGAEGGGGGMNDFLAALLGGGV